MWLSWDKSAEMSLQIYHGFLAASSSGLCELVTVNCLLYFVADKQYLSTNILAKCINELIQYQLRRCMLCRLDGF